MKPLVLSFLVLGMLAIPPGARADVAADVAGACETFGGSFETTTTGYGSGAVTTFTCRFADGSGRRCDSSGSCGSLDATSSSQTSATPDGSESASSASDPCYDCRKVCAEQCSKKGPPRAQLSCRRDCIEDRCQAECS